MSLNSVELAIFSGRLNAICEEMGFVLQRSALSPNIKDRLDFSCAFFDRHGRIVAQAAHIPVHLGSMAYAMGGLVEAFDWVAGDVLVLNDPFLGGTHLPDVTIISPCFFGHSLVGFFANRAHHANIGSSSPGSMPLSSDLSSEGVVIAPEKIFRAGELDPRVVAKLSKIEGGREDVIPGDFMAQISANRVGQTRLLDWMQQYSVSVGYLNAGINALNAHGSKLAGAFIESLPQGEAVFEDCMDGDGFGDTFIPVRCRVKIQEGEVFVDFSGTAPQVEGNINCPKSVTAASVYYVIHSLLPGHVPPCHGVFEHIGLEVPEKSLLNASSGAAVAAGNVETSMRIVDVLLGALSELGVDVPAASQGTMNNVALGSHKGERSWDYYETIGGGMGGGPKYPGLTAVQCHMTNTMNTPIESLEMHYPMQITAYEIRKGSGGKGAMPGGDGIVRTYLFHQQTSITVLSERRQVAPWGLKGGKPGMPGKNLLNGEVIQEKDSLIAYPGDELSVLTPGGGGWGLETRPKV